MRARRYLGVGVVAAALSCGGNEPQPEPGPPTSLQVIAGGAQTGIVGQELPQAVVVRVTDAQGQVVSGLLVNFVVTKGGGGVFAGSAQTNADGEARERWTLGPTAGEQILEARAVDQSTGDPIVFGRITATARHGPVAAFSLTAGARKIFLKESLDLATLVYDAMDQFGNAVENPPLTLDVPTPFIHEATTVSSDVETKGSVGLRSEDASGAVEVRAVRHLSELVGATGGWTCEGLLTNIVFGFKRLTRLEVRFVVDSATYPALIEGFTLGEAALWVTRDETRTFDDGSTSVDGPTPEGLVVLRQEPELLVIRRRAGSMYVSFEQDVAQTSANPLSYVGVGENLCEITWSPLTSSEPLTIMK